MDESSNRWPPDAAVYEIIRFSRVAYILPALRDVEGVEEWVQLHLRPIQGGIDISKEASIWTREGEAYTVCIEGTAHVQPARESIQAGIWQPEDWLITVSGIPYEALQAGDMLIQEKDARERAVRRRIGVK